jgi:hypothetical protein
MCQFVASPLKADQLCAVSIYNSLLGKPQPWSPTKPSASTRLPSIDFHPSNAKGRIETKAFKALGFTLVYKGKDIERGIELHARNCLESQSVKRYGLEESNMDMQGHPVAAAYSGLSGSKKLLKLRTKALRRPTHTHTSVYMVKYKIEEGKWMADTYGTDGDLKNLCLRCQPCGRHACTERCSG